MGLISINVSLGQDAGQVFKFAGEETLTIGKSSSVFEEMRKYLRDGRNCGDNETGVYGTM
jgi:hypothetical protein